MTAWVWFVVGSVLPVSFFFIIAFLPKKKKKIIFFKNKIKTLSHNIAVGLWQSMSNIFSAIITQTILSKTSNGIEIWAMALSLMW